MASTKTAYALVGENFPGRANIGLRAKIRNALPRGPEAVRDIASVVALSVLGRSKLEEVALAATPPRN